MIPVDDDSLLLDYDPSDTQELAWDKWNDKTTKEILFGGAKGGGKSHLGAAIIFSTALTYPGTRWFISRETLKDLTLYTTPTIHEVFQNWGIDITQYAKFNGSYNNFKLYNGSTVQFLECSFMPSDPLFERFGSMQWTGGWMEEGGENAEAAYINLKLGIGRWLNDKYGLPGKLLITSNPKKNWLKYKFVDPAKQKKLPDDLCFISSSIYDNTHRQKDYEKVLEQLTGTARQRLLLGDWDYDSDDDALISSEKIMDLFNNWHIAKDGAKYISCDVGRFGKDKTVIWVWEGFRVVAVTVLEKKDTHEVADEIKRLSSIHQIPMSSIVIDDDGVGGGVVDNLPNCVRFVNNSTPLPNPKNPDNKENFDNLKSQCYFALAELINKGGIFINFDLGTMTGVGGKSVKQLLSEELEQVRQKEVDGDKKKGVMPKDKVKEILGRSPDYSDGLMMRMIFEMKQSYTWTAM